MEIKKFKGLKNTTSNDRFNPGDLSVAENVDVDDTRRLLSRAGYTLSLAGAYHSLWSDGDLALVASANNLYRLNSDLTTTLLARLQASAPLSFNRQQNTTYFSNGLDTGRIAYGEVKSWGIRMPLGQPAAAPVGGGSLPPGRYMYALTFRRANGLESGTGTAGVVELTASLSGIRFSTIESSPDAEVAEKVLYLSGPNGVEMFRAAVLSPSTASYDYLGNGMDLADRLDTQYVSPPPAGSIVEVYNGCSYVVVGNAVFHSDPYLLENFRLRKSFLLFPGPVTMFLSVNDGIYVATDETTWFLPGGHPDGDMKSQVVFNYGAIPGTAVKTTRGILKAVDEEQEGEPGSTAIMWASPQGVCFGGESGQAQNLTDRGYSFPSAQSGAAIIRQARGYTQYLMALAGTGVATNAV